MLPIIWASTAHALPAAVGHQATHDPVARLKVRDGGSNVNDGASTFMRSGLRQRTREGAVGDEGVCVAERGDGNFYEEVGWCRRGGWDFLDGVRGIVDWAFFS